MPKTVNIERPADGEVMYNTDEKIFEDIKANPGEKAFVFIHTAVSYTHLTLPTTERV